MIISKKRFNKLVAAEVAEVLRLERQDDARDLARTEKFEKAKKDIERQCKEMGSFRKVGKRFKYLGVAFVVINIYGRRGNAQYGLFTPGTAIIVCEYIDPNGKIARRNFEYKMLPVLKAENERVH